MEPLQPNPSNSSAAPAKGSKIGRVIQKVADKVSDLVSSHSHFKVGEFITEKNVKAKPLKYDDLSLGGVYVLKYPPDANGKILYQIMKVVEKPPPRMFDRSVDIVMITDDKNEPQYVFASWMRKIKD